MSNKIDTVFVDMDGVLTDFVTGACKAHNKPCPFTNHPTTEHHGKYDLGEIWGMTPEEFWEPLRFTEFWFTLNKTPEADLLIEFLHSIPVTVKHLYILTAPSLSPNSHYGKAHWVLTHYPKLLTKTIFTSHKHLFAKPNTLLIDDSDKNIEQFKAHGGHTILVPRPWNAHHMLHTHTKENLMAALKRTLWSGELLEPIV